ncbi:hypothetical protein DEH18_27185 [Streptomyces sp. NHF165]|nr:hypothetical protein DEH18_27185 [Streptomyces sp. NHF165]
MTPSGASVETSWATASSTRVRPLPRGPVSRTERPRVSRRTRRSRSSSRSRSGPGAGARPAPGAAWGRGRPAGSSLPGTPGCRPGGQGSISLPSTGLTVSR